MDEQKRHDYKLPLEWIDRIFKRLAECYGAKFASRFVNPSYIDVERTRWQSGLYGTTADEIKHVLDLCRQKIIADPPNVIEFYHYCKGVRQPTQPKKSEYTRTEEQQKQGEKYLKLIMDKLHGRLDSEGQATFSALSKPVLANSDDEIKGHWQDN